MGHFSIGQLQAFRWVAELGSVQKAADKINLSQPSLSLRLKQLELELDAPLFEKRGRGLRLTRYGHTFLSRAKIVLDAYEDLQRSSETPEITGTLRIGVAEGFAVACMASLIKRLRDTFPLFKPEWTVATSPGMEQQIAAGELDMAILVEPIGLREVRLFALGSQANCWAIPSQTATGNDLTPNDLMQLTIITTPPPTAMYRSTLGWFAEQKHPPQNICLCSSLNAALQLVAAGLGAGIFPSRVVDAYPKKGAIRKLTSTPNLRDSRLFVADRVTSDEVQTQALIRAIEAAALDVQYFEA